MKLLFTHRYFWPDTAPYGVILKSIVGHFAQTDNAVHVFASKLSYRELGADAPAEMDGVDIRRCWVFQENKKNPITRAINVLLYCIGLFFHVLRLRPDVVTASTFPPVLAAWSGSLAARIVGAKFVYHMMDIHPDVSQISGGLLGRAPIANVLRWLDNHTLRRASAIVVLSQDMANTLAGRGLGALPIHVINNFMLDSDEAQDPPREWVKDANKKRVIFAGNLGRFQNLPLLAEGVATCFDTHSDLELMFLGDGAALSELRTRWGDHPQVTFAPFLPFAQAKALIADADVGLVSLNRDIYRVAYPSKMLTYLGLGVPVLALVEPESALAEEVSANGLGAVPEAATAEAIGVALRKVLGAGGSPALVKSWYTSKATKDVAMNHWEAVLDALREDRG
ncbi:hypothetical protein BFP76_10505 [Amylibacter kogurei]|uniref:Glycosyltransferase subfamily 4-like N-terminal domain-containing protein n=1 Tax=Paramylibacter kogurei TaxID=1889778 RepID=A0A2G5KBC2_9RHOB|nr:glycosyltransferase family 4 protein [Amylibacter kogurei]PIB26821.1 hypothetical protein BFP76_10505 [Amylibacter kogurei]